MNWQKHAGWIIGVSLALLAATVATPKAPLGGGLAILAALGVGFYIHWALNQ